MSAVAGSVDRGALFRQARLVFRRELATRVRSNLYVASLAFSLLLVVAIAALNAFGMSQSPILGMVGTQPPDATQALQYLRESANESTVDTKMFATVAELEQALLNGTVDVGVVNGDEVLVQDSPGSVTAQVRTAWQQAKLQALMASDSLSSDAKAQLTAALSPPSLRLLEPDRDSNGEFAVSAALVVLMFVSVQVMAGIVSTSVVEEKTGRIVESILASISARSLLVGKLGAAMVLGLIQIGLLIVAILVSTRIFDLGDIPPISAGLVAVALFWYLLGFLFFGALMAAASSLAASQEDAQATIMPVVGLSLLAYFVSFATSATPNALWARIVSVIPPISAFTIPGRYASGDLDWWEFGLAMVVNLIAIVFVVRIAERVYTRSIIGGDRKLSWRGALRSEAVR